jgi:ElaB/YqjD/DUF883 family membrane-anchored ribosome-binding protein
MERISGETEGRSDAGGTESHMHLRTGPADPVPGGDTADRPTDRARESYEELRGRAGEMAERTRERVSAGMERAGDLLESRTRVVALVRDNPLLAVGAAFSVGLVAGAATGATNRTWVVERARRQVKAAILSGIAAALAHEFRTILGVEDVGELLASIIGGEPTDEPEEYDEYEL